MGARGTRRTVVVISDEWTPGDEISGRGACCSCVIRLPLTYIWTDARAASLCFRAGKAEQIISVRIIPGGVRRAECVVDVGNNRIC